MRMSEEALRWVVAVVGGALIATRLPGFIYPEKIKKAVAKVAGLPAGWVRFFALIVGIFGVWLLYSTLVIIFSALPVFMVLSFLIGLILLAAGSLAVHPEWFSRLLHQLVIDRGNFFVRVICLVGLMGGVFVLLSAVFSNWGG